MSAELLELSIQSNTGDPSSPSLSSGSLTANITPRHISLAIRNDEELNSIFGHMTILGGGVLPTITPNVSKVPEVAEGKQAEFISCLVAGRNKTHPRLRP